MGDNGTFFGKALHMFGLFFKKPLWYEHGKIGVLDSGFLEHTVQDVPYILPDSIAPWFDDHASPYRRVFSQIRCFDHLLIPFRIVLVAPWCDRCPLLFSHINPLLHTAPLLLGRSLPVYLPAPYPPLFLS